MIKDWDEYYARMCVLASQKSEDQSTQCGSVIVTQGNEVISTGYNGFPRGVKDTPERQERPIKYKYFEHGERNAIYNCARIGVSTLGCKIYVTGVPCADCARAIVQSGIIEIIAVTGLHSPEFYERWKESTDFTKAMVEEAGVLLREYELPK